MTKLRYNLKVNALTLFLAVHTQDGRASSEQKFRLWFGSRYVRTETRPLAVTPHLAAAGVAALRRLASHTVTVTGNKTNNFNPLEGDAVSQMRGGVWSFLSFHCDSSTT